MTNISNVSFFVFLLAYTLQWLQPATVYLSWSKASFETASGGRTGVTPLLWAARTASCACASRVLFQALHLVDGRLPVTRRPGFRLGWSAVLVVATKKLGKAATRDGHPPGGGGEGGWWRSRRFIINNNNDKISK